MRKMSGADASWPINAQLTKSSTNHKKEKSAESDAPSLGSNERKIFMSVMYALQGIGTFLFTIVPSATATTTTTTTNGGDLFNGTTAYAINSTTHNSNNTTLIDVIIINNINNSMMGGYAETYMYRYLYNLGGNTVLISLTVTLGAPFECFFMLVTSYFVSLIGHAPLIMIGLFAYVIRLLGMSFLKDPWVVLLLEIVESMANGSLNTVAILYCTVLFSMESIASCRGLLGVMNNGVGRLLGTLLGSIIREALGDRVTFRVLAAGGMVFCVLYCLAFCLLKRYRYKAFSVKTSSLPARQQASRQGATNHACNVDE
ncbi:Major facilitator superfamily domain-containing protein 6-B-like [Homarus americanus]|uniref:Major facilitator superfamily domain-containing protein 6-B-like n=1 Tax=Homarus americanus TaxID=6706 RepID=A0A8J5MNG0_HOMAM|nr:Major facilitator superfamily domain-containing protein 6-B-like [Homarus americanus]